MSVHRRLLRNTVTNFTKRLKKFLTVKEIDEARILTEVAIYADKVAVNEETVKTWQSL